MRSLRNMQMLHIVQRLAIVVSSIYLQHTELQHTEEGMEWIEKEHPHMHLFRCLPFFYLLDRVLVSTEGKKQKNRIVRSI